MTNKPQEVQFGDQHPKDAEVQFGKHPETAETKVSQAGDSDPSLIGFVPLYAGGDRVPASAFEDDDQDAQDAPDQDGGDENTSDDDDDAQDAPGADDTD